ncbi:GlxA family transcriptional regulator [Burkholderia ubonensis]|uniref:AraC family transcriptional regulator n=1 Tax=Burkholderia ubonensis TaxID=101571 RepID=A0A102MUG5_9BURK|nr:GlxA family transcriptional regulator [Burkholderia ubonensis]AOI74616.1 AraC family transcriptional regulator [Burkholderia ubonensis]KUZ12657.1 AraC family transcriptional regulator [Burkholderia ubonensis]KUZ33851.1 AraC family transcriptional regulator [Burkholderia ubonensis]KUZ41433.1 AraC family transcriptional regulator [Burkholderia ubonensis]KUZ48682.1 AraC family transcriptional regulator [Burkholderia ubonensis]
MHRIGYLLTDEFQVMAIGTQTIFEFANVLARERVYQVTNYSISGGPIRSSLGVSVVTEAMNSRTAADTWMISGVIDPTNHVTPASELELIVDASARSRRIAGLCTGAFALAEAGLLDGRRATTHWAYVEALKARYPLTQVEDDRIFIVDGSIWTSAGLTAAMDLALGMVEKDLGPDIATSVARVLVMERRRSGGQPQQSQLLELAPKSDRIQMALTYARQNLSKPLRVDDLAKAAHLSTRQFGRIFLSETGQSPAKAIEQLRLEVARNMVECSRHSLEIIARETGFRDRRHLREVFVRGYGVSPQSLRRDSRTPAADETV